METLQFRLVMILSFVKYRVKQSLSSHVYGSREENPVVERSKKLRPKADYVDSQLEYEQAYATIRDDGWYPRWNPFRVRFNTREQGIIWPTFRLVINFYCVFWSVRFFVSAHRKKGERVVVLRIKRDVGVMPR